MKLVLVLFLALGGIFAYAASSDKLKQKAGETADAASEYAHESKEEFRKGMESDLAKLKIQIAELQEKMSKAQGEARVSLGEQLKKVEEKRQGLSKDIAKDWDETSDKSGRAWGQMREGFEKAMGEIKTAVAKAKQEIQVKRAEKGPKGKTE